MDDTKSSDTETPTDDAPEPTAVDAVTDKDAAAAPADAEQQALWRAGLVQEALSNRPELRRLAAKKDFAISRKIGYDLGFEDGARKLTLDQLDAFTTLKERRLARYVRQELPVELHGYLDERSVGLDEEGFLAGYVDGVADFLQAYKEQLHRES